MFNGKCLMFRKVKNHLGEVNPVALNCLSRPDGHFLAIKPKSGVGGILPGEKANAVST